ncbi:MAG: ABC transporter permease [Clostridiales bacterium]|jgi:spermidine/putrescine transport system permease protein|nr:ABC transporter permease [Clostridiales bacterium]
MKRTVFAAPYAVWMAIFIFAPMLLIGYYAFTDGGDFTLANMRAGLDAMYMQVLIRSIWLAFRATLLCLLLGYPIAYLLSRMKHGTATLLSVFFVVPMWMNFLLRTYAWQVLLDSGGILNSLLISLNMPGQQLLYTEAAVLLGMVYNFLPFMILPVYTVLTKMDASHIEAARDLGANGMQTFFRVVLPLSMPGVISGVTMVFIPAITTFAISRLLGGGMFMLYGDLMENQFLLLNDWGSGSALSFILLILVIISMAVMRRAERQAGEEGAKLW